MEAMHLDHQSVNQFQLAKQVISHHTDCIVLNNVVVHRHVQVELESDIEDKSSNSSTSTNKEITPLYAQSLKASLKRPNGLRLMPNFEIRPQI